MAMKNSLLLLGILAIFSASCLNTEKKNNTDEKLQDSVNPKKSTDETIFQIDLQYFSNELYRDSIIVKYDIANRNLLIVYSCKGERIDSTRVFEVNEINRYDRIKGGYFGIEVTLRCGSDCSSHEYHLFKAENDTLYNVLSFQSYFYHAMDKMFDKYIDSMYYIHERSEYAAELVNISRYENYVTVFEHQVEEYHYYNQIPQNYTQVYNLKWDSLNHVYCNSYIDLNGEYHCYYRDGTEKDVEFHGNNYPTFENKKHIYVFVNKVWVILMENNELRFMQMP